MTQTKCHLEEAATMDSPAYNFYDNTDFQKQPSYKLYELKQEPLEETSGALGDFLNSEESVDILDYLGGYDQGHNSVPATVAANHGPGHSRRLTEVTTSGTLDPSPRLSAQAQQPQCSGESELMHFETIPQHIGVESMPLNHPAENPIIGAQADSIVPELTYDVMQQLQQHGLAASVQLDLEPEPEVEVNTSSACTSAASSPGRSTFGEGFAGQNEASSSCNSPSPSGSGKKRRPNPPPGSEEYKEKRQRNNIAVRKCRMKTKQKNKELQDKVKELQDENKNLKKRVEMLSKELTVLKSLFTNVDRPAPPPLERATVNM